MCMCTTYSLGLRLIMRPETVMKQIEQTNQASDNQVESYVLNTNNKKFHKPTCSSVKDMKEKNKETYEGTREELIQKGYEPCGRCKP